MAISPLQRQIRELESKAGTLDSIIAVAKTDGGRLTAAGKSLIPVLRKAGLSKSEVARVLSVTPAALTKYA